MKNLNLSIVVPLVTPCTPDGEIDKDGLQNLCDHCMDAGCTAFFVAGTTGRGPWFTLKQLEYVCRIVSSKLNKRFPLFAGCMDTGLGRMLENAIAMRDNGADIAVVTAPYYFKYTSQELESLLLKFADKSPLKVLVYDIAEFAGTKFQKDMVSRLSKHENIIGVKDSSSDITAFSELINENRRNRPDFVFLQGQEWILLDALKSGATGFVCSLIQLNPKPFVKLSEFVRTKQMDKAEAVQKIINKISNVVEESWKQRPATSTLLCMINHSLKKRGVCRNILLEHELQCPASLAKLTDELLELCETIEELDN